MTKILTNRPKFALSRPWNAGQEVMALVYSCWSHRYTLSSEKQLATINRSWDSTLDKNLNLDNLAKVLNQWTVKYRSWDHGSCIFLLVSWRSILRWNINMLPLIDLAILPWTKILTWITWPKSSQWTVKCRSWDHDSCIFFCWSHRDTSLYEMSSYYH